LGLEERLELYLWRALTLRLESRAVGFGDAVCGLFFARKYCRPKKTVTRTSIMTSSDLLSPPPC